MIRTEFEEKLNQSNLHIYMEGAYKEDYQMQMLGQNAIYGILPVEGCEIEGKACYTYDIVGMKAMKSKYEKGGMGKAEIAGMIKQLLKVIENLQEYMLNPDCLVLEPEYIFYKKEQCYFCYLPEKKEKLKPAFHELTEYFLKTLDYDDTEGIFLAYELHKATLQEHYDLQQIMEKYEEKYEEHYETEEDDVWEDEPEHEPGHIQTKQIRYEDIPKAETVREENGFFLSWRKAMSKFRKNRSEDLYI